MAMDVFLKLDGIKGEAQDSKHKDEIDVLSWSWGLSQSGSSHTGGGSGSGKVSVQDLHFTKYVDSASPTLQLKCCDGTHVKEAVLVLRKSGTTPLEYLKITFNDLIVSSIQSGGSGSEDRLTESISLNFAKFKTEYTKQKADGSADGGAITAGWNIPKNEKV